MSTTEILGFFFVVFSTCFTAFIFMTAAIYSLVIGWKTIRRRYETGLRTEEDERELRNMTRS